MTKLCHSEKFGFRTARGACGEGTSIKYVLGGCLETGGSALGVLACAQTVLVDVLWACWLGAQNLPNRKNDKTFVIQILVSDAWGRTGNEGQAQWGTTNNNCQTLYCL